MCTQAHFGDPALPPPPPHVCTSSSKHVVAASTLVVPFSMHAHWLHCLTKYQFSEIMIPSLGCPCSPFASAVSFESSSPHWALVSIDWILDVLHRPSNHDCCLSKLSQSLTVGGVLLVNYDMLVSVFLFVICSFLAFLVCPSGFMTQPC